MNANELRIGNWVFGHDPQSMAHGEQRYFKVDEISEDGINCWRVEGFSNEYAKCKPIPLTPEILEKCGFVKEDDGISPYLKLVINRTEVISIEDDFSIGLNAENESSKVGYASNPDVCKHLHQLQNLYYALTQTELPITKLK